MGIIAIKLAALVVVAGTFASTPAPVEAPVVPITTQVTVNASAGLQG